MVLSSAMSGPRGDALDRPRPTRTRARDVLGLERSVVAISAATFLLALGENLWKRFVPKYLEALGAPVTAIGLFGSFQDLLDGVYQCAHLGGVAIAAYGPVGGVRLGLALTVVLAVLTLGAVWRVNIPVARDAAPTNVLGVWRSLPTPLRWLLASDIFIRTCEGLVDVFLVLYVTNIIGITAPQFGALIAVQAATSIISYLPAAVVADRIGRKPFVIATFVAFAAFPIAVVLAHDIPTLLVAFVVGGLREVGEPARKAMIVDLVPPQVRARSIGLYYLMRSVAIAPAAFTGGLLWSLAPAVPFWMAGLIGLMGVAVFAVTVDEQDAN